MEFPVFIGHKGLTQVYSQILFDDQYLYIRSKLNDQNIIKDLQGIENNDGVAIYLDVNGHSYDKPDVGIFKIFHSADNQLFVYEGQNGQYKP